MCYHRPCVRMEDHCLQALSIHLAWSFTARTVDDWFANDALTILWVYLVGFREENILSPLLNLSSMDRTTCPRWFCRCHSCLHRNTNGGDKQTIWKLGEQAEHSNSSSVGWQGKKYMLTYSMRPGTRFGVTADRSSLGNVLTVAHRRSLLDGHVHLEKWCAHYTGFK